MNQPVKTAEGQDELTRRTRRLSQRHRTVLLLVDGQRSAEEVRALASQAGAPDGCFDELLALGLIALRAEAELAGQGPVQALAPQPVVERAAPPREEEHDSSLLPPSRTLQPESVLGDLLLADSGLPEPMPAELLALADAEQRLDEARELLMRAVRAQAPVAGSMTLLRLKRARSGADLAALLGEVEARIVKPHRSLAAQQTLQRVRQLLAADSASVLPLAG